MKSCKQNSRRPELDLLRGLSRIPLSDVLNVAWLYCPAILKPKKIFKQDFDGIRNAGNIGPRFAQSIQTKDLVVGAIDAQR